MKNNVKISSKIIKSTAKDEKQASSSSDSRNRVKIGYDGGLEKPSDELQQEVQEKQGGDEFRLERSLKKRKLNQLSKMHVVRMGTYACKGKEFKEENSYRGEEKEGEE